MLKFNSLNKTNLILLIPKAQSPMKKTCNSLDPISQLETLVKLTMAHTSDTFQRTFSKTVMIFSSDQFSPTMPSKKMLEENQQENSGSTNPLQRLLQEKFSQHTKAFMVLNLNHTLRNILIKHGDISMLTELEKSKQLKLLKLWDSSLQIKEWVSEKMDSEINEIKIYIFKIFILKTKVRFLILII